MPFSFKSKSPTKTDKWGEDFYFFLNLNPEWWSKTTVAQSAVCGLRVEALALHVSAYQRSCLLSPSRDFWINPPAPSQGLVLPHVLSGNYQKQIQKCSISMNQHKREIHWKEKMENINNTNYNLWHVEEFLHCNKSILGSLNVCQGSPKKKPNQKTELN